MKLSRENNFDLIRLIAALQVVLWHSKEHLHIEGLNSLFYVISFIPGVPIFFSMSGFLIFASFERNSDNKKQYFKNRFYRLYPGLWTSVILSVILIISTSNIELNLFYSSTFYTWILAQVTIFQFWTPDILRSWGVGTPNGVLWTIIVEIQYYLSVPILFFILKKIKNNHLTFIFIAIIFSIIFNFALSDYSNSTSIIIKFLQISLFPFLYYFLFGVIFYLKYDLIIKFLKNKFFIWLAIYFLYCFIFSNRLGLFSPSYWPNIIGIISQIILVIMFFSFAYSFGGLSKKLLKGVDISYGIYLYHMLIINTILSFSITGIYALLLCITITICIGIISWYLIEKPSLKLKNN